MDMNKDHLFVKSEGEGHGTTFTSLLLLIVRMISNMTNAAMISISAKVANLYYYPRVLM